ncbi:MAG TPA: aminotransferase class I/II-fold pyridoxal phosphate-dependent enzyme [Pyrinomonadaceae bacterium]|nr:aminotransferase class I/II-fold pyridoxal phosphate-dependent enzyme [Pyrinomonadaceae bacterium]
MTSASGSPQFSNLVDLIRHRAAEQPDRLAYSFLVDGEDEVNNLTYLELERASRAVGARLQAAVAPGERALLLYQPGLEYVTAFFGCLYAGVIAVPAYPPRPNQSLLRLQAIVGDAQAKVVLIASSVLGSVKRQLADFPDLQALTWITTDDIAEGIENSWRDPKLNRDDVAFIQYTSGSTMAPKGVMLSHRNVMHNLSLIHQCFRHSPESRGMVWLPPYHDMGLIGGVLQPLYAGFPVTLMSPYAFLQRPLRWLQAITRTKATSSGGPNFAYDLCVRRISADQLPSLDLSSWDLAFNGAEPIRHETLDAFARKFEPCGFRREAFYPCYGLAEATLIVTGGLKEAAPVVAGFDREALERNLVKASSNHTETTRTLVGCGRRIVDQQIAIVDPTTGVPCTNGKVGEIWVSGPSVAVGYWGRPQETNEAFQARILANGDGPYLRTGDVGFVHDNELFVTGRLKDLIIIRGRNYYPHDIELTAERSHPHLRPGGGAAFSVDVNGAECLIVAQEVERQYLRNLNAEEIIDAVRQAIAEHYDLRVHAVALVKTGALPKTSSGKIQRHACRASFLNGGLPIVGAWTEKSLDSEVHLSADPVETNEVEPPADLPSAERIREWLIAKLAERLKTDASNIRIDEQFASYGLDSVAAVSLSSEMEDWLGRRLSPNLLWDYPTIDGLSRHLASGAASQQDYDEALPEHYTFELFPEYLGLKQLMGAVELGGGNPYLKVNDQITRNTTVINDRECINFSAYNYLGMSGDPVVSAAAKEAIDIYGTSVSASRVASGERPFHRELEQEIAGLIGTDDCIVYIGGHTANVTTISTLFGPTDLIMYDAFSHDSVNQGCLLSGARSLPFPHNDWDALDRLLSEHRRRYRRVLIVIEGVYSMDGDIPELPRFIEVKRRHKAILMIDEAHSIGVLGPHGRGISEYFGVAGADVDLWMGTLSKSFASCGGYIAGTHAVVEYLKYFGSGFVYSVGISPPNAAAALAAIRLLKREPERVSRLHDRANLFLHLAEKHGLNKGTSKDSPVVPVIVGDSFRCIALSRALLDRGINVQPIIHPAVEDKAARLRFFINCTHTEEQIRFTVDSIAHEFERLGNQAQAASFLAG